MKTLIMSDVHSNIAALEAVWSKESDSDMVICAGDIVHGGVNPNECIEWMIDKQAKAVMGNHDRAVIEAYNNPDIDRPDKSEIANARKLTEQNYKYLCSLPSQLVLEIDSSVYGVTHDYRNYEIVRPAEEFSRFVREVFSQSLEKIILGHTHRRELHYFSNDEFWLNPGSISYRHEESYKGSHYAVIVGGRISLREVQGQ